MWRRLRLRPSRALRGRFLVSDPRGICDVGTQASGNERSRVATLRTNSSAVRNSSIRVASANEAGGYVMNGVSALGPLCRAMRTPFSPSGNDSLVLCVSLRSCFRGEALTPCLSYAFLACRWRSVPSKLFFSTTSAKIALSFPAEYSSRRASSPPGFFLSNKRTVPTSSMPCAPALLVRFVLQAIDLWLSPDAFRADGSEP